MKDKDFEKWLIREEGILKVAKEVDDWCDNDVFVDELYKRYRQIEKDNVDLVVSNLQGTDILERVKIANAELLAALKPFTHPLREYQPPVLSDIEQATKVHTKHKGE